MPQRSDVLSVAGVHTHLRRGGRGRPLLVLHPEFAPSQWFPYLDPLAARFEVFAPDHPGFGNSARPDWLDGIDDLVIHYLDLLDLLELDRVSIVGTSLGGWIAAELAVVQPQRIDRLVLAGAAGLRVDGADRMDVFLRPLDQTLTQLFYDPTRAAQFLPASSGTDAIVHAYRDATTLARLAWNPYLYHPKLERRLRRITAPTLIVWGREDRMLPLPHGQAFARCIPNARLTCVPECGHLVPFEQPERFGDIVLPFLAGDA